MKLGRNYTEIAGKTFKLPESPTMITLTLSKDAIPMFENRKIATTTNRNL